MTADPTRTVVLASASAARRRMLEAAGVAIEVRPVRVDEESVIASLASDGVKPRNIADALAELKTLRGAQGFSGRLILGADQVLECDGRPFVKPTSRAGAATQLRALRGRKHDLWSAACLARNDAIIWRFVGRATLSMRDFSDDFLDSYLDEAGDAVTSSAGAYQIEGLGAQLFTRVEGDTFTVQGLPLLQVLEALRVQGALAQ